MSNNIKKGLVILSLAMVYVSGSAAEPIENTQNQGPQAGKVPVQQDHGTYNQTPSMLHPNGNPNIPHHKDHHLPPH